MGRRRYFRSQNYKRLKADCAKKRNLFVDIQFPPTNDSLFINPHEQNANIIWKRPSVSFLFLFIEKLSF